MERLPFIPSPGEQAGRRSTRIVRRIGSLSLAQKIDFWHDSADSLSGYPSDPSMTIHTNAQPRTVPVDPQAIYPKGYRESSKAYEVWTHKTHELIKNVDRLQMEDGVYGIDPSTGRSSWRDSNGSIERYGRSTRRRIIREEKRYSRLSADESHGHTQDQDSFISNFGEARRYILPVRQHNAAVVARKKADLEKEKMMKQLPDGHPNKGKFNLVTDRYVSGLYEPWKNPQKKNKRKSPRFTKAKLRKIEPEDEGFWF